jgi:hypothetical protein
MPRAGDRVIEKLLSSASRVVLIWGLFNGVLVAVLAGFVLAGFGASLFIVEIYGASAVAVIVASGAVFLGRRRRPWLRGLRVPYRAASVIVFAVGMLVLWLGLAFGKWLSIMAAAPFVAAAVMEISVHRKKSE